MELLSRLDYFQVARRIIYGRAQKIDPAVVDIAGSNLNILAASSSFMAQTVGRQLADGMRSLTLAAERDDLDRVIVDRYGLPRKGAAAAVVPLEFSRGSAAAGGGTLVVGTRVSSLSGVEYVLTSAASFGSSQLSGVTADARAVQAGFAYQVGTNQIRRFSDASLIFDPSIAVNNAEPAAGGTQRESDEAYRERGRRFYLAVRRGTLGAIEVAATEIEGVASAVASDVMAAGQPARAVQLLVADDAGVCNRVLAARVVARLRESRAGGIWVTVLSSVPQLVSVALRLSFAANVDTTVLASQIRSAVADFVNGLAAGQPLLRGDLFAVLSRYRASGLIVLDDSVASPTGDLYPDSGRTLRCRLEDVTLT